MDEQEGDRNEDGEDETSFGGDDYEEVMYPARRYPDGRVIPRRIGRVRINRDEETRPLIDPVERRERDKEKAEDFLKSVFVDPQLDEILYRVEDYDSVWVSLTGKRSTRYVHQPSGRFLNQSKKEMPKSLKQLLGETIDEELDQNDQIMRQNEEEMARLRASPERERASLPIGDRKREESLGPVS